MASRFLTPRVGVPYIACVRSNVCTYAHAGREATEELFGTGTRAREMPTDAPRGARSHAGRDEEASIESRMEGGEMLRQYYLDHFQALIEAKPATLEKKRGGANEDDKEIDK